LFFRQRSKVIHAPQQGDFIMLTLRSTLLTAASLALALTTYAEYRHSPGNPGHPADSQAPATQPNIDYQHVKRTLEANRQQIENSPALAPETRQQLTPGQPVPDGVSRRLSPDIEEQIPQYQGYEWHQAGEDVLLIKENGLVYEVMRNALD
jgi:hypothetical protein